MVDIIYSSSLLVQLFHSMRNFSAGHTQAWGPGVDKLLTACYDSKGKKNGKFGPIDPTVEKNYEFLRHFFKEVATVFPDKYLHLGGDEVDYSCW